MSIDKLYKDLLLAYVNLHIDILILVILCLFIKLQ